MGRGRGRTADLPLQGLAEDERCLYVYARSLIGLIRAAGASLLITSESTTLGPSPEPVRGVTFLFHNLILMRYIELDSTSGRALNVVKMRNSNHSKDMHQFEIGDDGLTIGNRLEGVAGVLGWSALRVSNILGDA